MARLYKKDIEFLENKLTSMNRRMKSYCDTEATYRRTGNKEKEALYNARFEKKAFEVYRLEAVIFQLGYNVTYDYNKDSDETIARIVKR